MDFLCGLVRFQQEHEASEENVAFLRECLDEAAIMYSDFKNKLIAVVK